MIGTGVLTLPWATAQVGLLLSAVGLLCLAWLSQAAIRLAVLCQVSIYAAPQERKSIIESLRGSYCGTPLVEDGEPSGAACGKQPADGRLRTSSSSGAHKPGPSSFDSADVLSRSRSESAPFHGQATGGGPAHPALPSGRLDSGLLSRLSSSKLTTVVSDGHGAGTWQLIATAAFGSTGRMVTVGALLIAQFGTCVSYLDFMAGVLHEHAALPQGACVLMLWGVLSLLSTLRNMKAVSYLSFVALLVYCYVFTLLVFTGCRLLQGQSIELSSVAGLGSHNSFVRNAAAAPLSASPPAPPTAPPPGALLLLSPARIGAWFGPSVFAFEGMGTALSIYESMELDEPAPFFRVVGSAYAVTLCLYLGLASFVYVAWGNGVAKVVIDSLPEDTALSAEVALTVVLSLSFVLQMTPVYHVVEDLVHQPGLLPARGWPLSRAAVVGLVALVAYLVPDMEQMVSLTGAVAFSAIGFVLPGLFYLKLQPERTPQDATAPTERCTLPRPLGNNAAALTMVVLGAVGAIWGVISVVS
eukprot:6356984-Prymnesium_polylepis.1